MRKTTIKKMLALVVGVIIITASLTAGFSVFADDTANAGPLNLDFSDGLNHWKGETSIYSVDGGVLKINDSYTEGSWRFLKTEPFSIPNAVAGTTVELYFDVDFEDGLTSMEGTSNYEGALASQVGYKLLDVYLADPALNDHVTRMSSCTEANGQRNEVFYNEEGTVALGPVELVDGTETLDFWIGCGNSSKKTWEVTNITLKVTHPDGTVDVYPEGAEVPTPPSGDGDEEPEAPVVTYPEYFGTEADGVDSNLTHYPCQLTPADDIYNLDFSDGFICWGGKALANAGDVASSAFDIITEADGNKYAQVKADGYVSNISTVLFKAKNVQAGDNLVVIYDVKGEDGFMIRTKLVQEFLKQVAVYDETTGLNTALKTDGSGALLNVCPGIPAVPVGTGVENGEFALQTEKDGWTTLIAETSLAIYDPKSSPAAAGTKDTLRDDIFLQVVVTCGDAGAQPGDIIDAAIDNIRIAKVVDGVYYNVVDNSVIYDPNAGGNDGTGDGGNQGEGSVTTGDSVLALAALFFVSGAAVFGTAKAMKSR